MKRPTGVTVIAVLLWVVGVAGVVTGLSIASDTSGVLGGAQVAIGVAAVAFGIGCWRMRPWARWGTILLMGINALSLVTLWVRYSDQIIVSRLVVPLIINVIVVLYLLQPAVVTAFAAKPESA